MVLTRRNVNEILKNVIKYQNVKIDFNSIKEFENKSRKKNDNNNKNREFIIGAIINKKIPEEFYNYSNTWNNLKEGLFKCLKHFPYKNIEVIHKGGRKYNYDYDLLIDGKIYKFEFKYFNSINFIKFK